MKKIVTTSALLLVFSVMLFSCIDVRIAKTEANTIIVPDDYSTIQEAIGGASEGDTIFVKRGTYHEHLQVDKSLSLVGEDMETTIIDGDNVGQVVNITACDHVNITCFTIRNSGPLGEGYSSAGIGLWEANYCNISANKVTTNAFGIVAIASYSNIIFENIIEENSGSGVTIDGWGYPNYNSIHGNEIVNNIGGVEISSGKNNTIYENNITKNGNEIILDDSHNNSILRNNIGSLGSGSITFTFSSNNTFQHNNFKNIQVVDRGWLVPPWIPNSSINIWDNGIEGNYWNNYQGSDHNGDGIGDKPHTINENNQDNHPLMEPFIIPEFPAWTPLLIMLVAVAVLIYKRKLSQTPAN
jgi:nitrous oxidase accessory protein